MGPGCSRKQPHLGNCLFCSGTSVFEIRKALVNLSLQLIHGLMKKTISGTHFFYFSIFEASNISARTPGLLQSTLLIAVQRTNVMNLLNTCLAKSHLASEKIASKDWTTLDSLSFEAPLPLAPNSYQLQKG